MAESLSGMPGADSCTSGRPRKDQDLESSLFLSLRWSRSYWSDGLRRSGRSSQFKQLVLVEIDLVGPLIVVDVGDVDCQLGLVGSVGRFEPVTWPIRFIKFVHLVDLSSSNDVPWELTLERHAPTQFSSNTLHRLSSMCRTASRDGIVATENYYFLEASETTPLGSGRIP